MPISVAFGAGLGGATGDGGFCTGMPCNVDGFEERALRTTLPCDHRSSVAHCSQRTTACAGPFTTDSGSGF
jgi:hypothetical protein